MDGNDYEDFEPEPDDFGETSTARDAEIPESGAGRMKFNDEMDFKFGFDRYTDVLAKDAWLLNMHPAEWKQDEQIVSAVDYYFIQDDGSRFKVTLPYQPYFYLAVAEGKELEVLQFVSKKYAGIIAHLESVDKEDLDYPNHLTGLKRTYIKLAFYSVNDLMKAKKELMPRIRKNKERIKHRNEYTELLASSISGCGQYSAAPKQSDLFDHIVDIREYDVPYHVRVSIDLRIFVGKWYTVIGTGPERIPVIQPNTQLVDRPDPVVLAFDIETTKLPLKFPDSSFDEIMMISYMIDGNGYLIINREIVSEDVEDFEYTPKPEYEGPFTVFNETNEKELLIKFFDHIMEVKPHIFVTYNGDFFDWPFVEARALKYGLKLENELGFSKDNQGEYKARQCIHMDAFRWVKRDSYLPVGSQNLKATAKAKLRYDPVELDPEEMCKMAREQPQVLANYSVSDAVATYYLYMKYVHPFIFALCTIIPMEPDEVLRKGSGTLCEALLMVEAYHANIVFPNKQVSEDKRWSNDGHLIESETYVGGHVEALESGVYRSNLPCRFRLVPQAYQSLVDTVDKTMKHALEVEEGVPIEDVDNFEEICSEITEKLVNLRDHPNRMEQPVIYHLDVGAMYPNIILTNRLQPPAIVNESVCAKCDFNRHGAKCQRSMEWKYRAEIVPASRNEYNNILQQLEGEKFPPAHPGGPHRAFHHLPHEERNKIEKTRLNEYCRKAYKKLHETRIELKHTTVCQRENSFYVDTVRAFRDRRYEYKALLKKAKKSLSEAMSEGDPSEIKSARGKEVLYDSLQLAHKCILNSFYGYVMRRGSRWFSMEMAGIVCYTGANIITRAREIVEQIGRPLELDTDGIWCIMPASFPENFTFKTRNSKKPKVTVSYPGAMLNVMVKDEFTNDQYHTLVDAEKLEYKIENENSIFFEVDGPYLAMVLPASKEEGKKLKKRYAVFNHDGSLAELKGFEVKRRGELHLIKNFQSSVFDAFLKGETLEECYQAVARVADYWLDVLFSKGVDLPDSELFELISENRSMSRKLEDYGAQKSTSISTARRLAEFLGDQMVKDAGLACKFIISRKPEGAPVTERAIPLAIFQADPSECKRYLKKWLKVSSIETLDIRDILDWQYYIERLGSAIQKIITIPAVMQGVSNPVPRVAHPDWLHKRLLEKTDSVLQPKIDQIFAKIPKEQRQKDMEDIGKNNVAKKNGRAEDASGVTARKRTLSGQFARPTNASSSQVSSQPRPTPIVYRSWKDVLGQCPHTGNTRNSQIEWLAFQKKKWAHQRLQRKERSRSIRRRTAPIGMDTFIQASAKSVLNSPWQILQIAETSRPGQFRMWILCREEVYKFNLVVPRTFYVNQKVEKEERNDSTYTKVTHKHLPRMHQVMHLYEYKVDESDFIKHLNDLKSELNAPHVEGFYETQVPSIFRALAQLGCVCQVKEEAKRTINSLDTFDLSNLEFVTLGEETCGYLDKPGLLRTLFLYHYSQDTRSCYALIIPATKKGYFYLVDKGKADVRLNLNKLYDDALKRSMEVSPDAELPKENHEFELHIETDIKAVHRQVTRHLKDYRDQKFGPSVVVLMSTLSNRQLEQSIVQLTELPIVRLPFHDSSRLFTNFNWQKDACTRVVKHYLSYSENVKRYADLCRYLHIPVGNIPEPDPWTYGIDLFFARALWNSNHIIWCSSLERPDLGGKEGDDHRLLVDPTELGSHLNKQAPSVFINKPGLYPSICVEIEVQNLPVLAMLHSQRIAEEEGTAGVIGFGSNTSKGIDELVMGPQTKNISTYDETTLCSPVMNILKLLVAQWMKEVRLHKNPVADEIAYHFYRWISSPSSLLYDPALKKCLQIVMKKLGLFIISELQKAGSTVYHASFNKIYLCTKKQDFLDAQTYLDYISHMLREKAMLRFLHMSPDKWWNVVLWIDESNWGGIPVQNIDENSMVDFEEDALPNPVLDFNMKLFLPTVAACQINFDHKVSGYLLFVLKQLKDLKVVLGTETATQKALQTKIRAAAGFTVQDITGSPPGLAEACQKMLVDDLLPTLLNLIQRMQHKVSTETRRYHMEGEPRAPSDLFPKLPGSHLNFTSPALEFTKTLCRVLSVDQNVTDTVAKMKRDMLKLLGAGEFDEVAEFRDPCLSYILPGVICPGCQQCRDVDLCRDSHIVQEEGQLVGWRCTGGRDGSGSCGRMYDNLCIESALLTHLNNLSVQFNLQDLKCIKCRQIKEDHMSLSCACGGIFALILSHHELALRLKTFRNLAETYSMHMLLEQVEWTLMGDSQLRKLIR